MSKFDAAIQSLHDTIDDYGVIGVPEICDSCRAAIRVLEAAAKVDKEKAKLAAAYMEPISKDGDDGADQIYDLLSALPDKEAK